MFGFGHSLFEKCCIKRSFYLPIIPPSSLQLPLLNLHRSRDRRCILPGPFMYVEFLLSERVVEHRESPKLLQNSIKYVSACSNIHLFFLGSDPVPVISEPSLIGKNVLLHCKSFQGNYSDCKVSWVRLRGPVIQANGRLTYEDDLRSGGLLCFTTQ